jgi:hypothetical protein
MTSRPPIILHSHCALFVKHRSALPAQMPHLVIVVSTPGPRAHRRGSFERLASGYVRGVDVRAASGRMLRAERKVLRVQRRLWLAQLAFWPAVIALAAVGIVAAWKLWQRSAQRRPEGNAGTTVPTQPDAPIAGAGPG